MGGCLSVPPVEECCWNDVCFPCYPQFWGSDIQIFYGEVAMTLGGIILFIITIYNIYVCIFEARRYHAAAAKGGYNKIGYDPEPKKIVGSNDEQNLASEIEIGTINNETTTNTTDAKTDEAKDDNTESDDVKDEETVKYVPYPWMRLIHIGYPFVTGWFAIFRAVWLLGKPLLIGAALHNLFEWFMLAYAFFPTPRARTISNASSILFIWIIIVLVVGIVSFPQYGLLEQVTGIALDFGLPIVWTILYTQVKKDNPNYNQVKSVWRLAMIAHYTHLFGTIIPLVIGNFTVYQNKTLSAFLETIILFFTPFTHILYTMFATEYQTYILTGPVISDEYVVQAGPKCCKKCNNTFKCCGVPCQGFGLMVFWFIIAIFIGLLPTTIIPEIITVANDGLVYNNITGKCDAMAPDLNDPDWFIIDTDTSSTAVCSGTTYRGQSAGIVYPELIEEFQRYVLSDEGYGLISKARAQAGNIKYEVILDVNTFRWEEEWENFDAVFAWARMGPPATVFSDPIVNNMFVDGALTVINNLAGASGEEPCIGTNSNLTAGFVFDINGVFACQSLWNDLTDTSSCAWIKDCINTQNIVVDATTGFTSRTIVLNGGSTYEQTITLQSSDVFQYYFDYNEMDSSITSSIALNQTNNGTCNVHWTFNAIESYSTSLLTFYSTLNTNNIDHVKSLYP